MKRKYLRDLKTGDIILTSGSSTLANMIEYFQGIQDNSEVSHEYSHSGVIFIDAGIIYIVESQKEGIVMNNFVNRYMNTDYDKLMLLRPIHAIDYIGAKRLIYNYIGKAKYDFFNLIIAQPIKIITGKLFGREIWLGEKKQKDKNFICHEWSAFFHNKVSCRTIFKKETGINSKDIYDNNNFKHYILK